jgi:hypothetical protein
LNLINDNFCLCSVAIMPNGMVAFAYCELAKMIKEVRLWLAPLSIRLHEKELLIMLVLKQVYVLEVLLHLV